MSETAGEAAKLTIQELVDANHIPFDQGVVTVSGRKSTAHGSYGSGPRGRDRWWGELYLHRPVATRPKWPSPTAPDCAA